MLRHTRIIFLAVSHSFPVRTLVKTFLFVQFSFYCTVLLARRIDMRLWCLNTKTVCLQYIHIIPPPHPVSHPEFDFVQQVRTERLDSSRVSDGSFATVRINCLHNMGLCTIKPKKSRVSRNGWPWVWSVGVWDSELHEKFLTVRRCWLTKLGVSKVRVKKGWAQMVSVYVSSVLNSGTHTHIHLNYEFFLSPSMGALLHGGSHGSFWCSESTTSGMIWSYVNR